MSDVLAITKSMLGFSDTTEYDDIINDYLLIAKQTILNRIYQYGYETTEEVPTYYEHIQCQIACYLFNKRGAEGETSHNENGITRGYADADVPSDLLKLVVPKVGVLK